MPVYTYTTLDDPFALTGTEAGDLNATGQVAGNREALPPRGENSYARRAADEPSAGPDRIAWQAP